MDLNQTMQHFAARKAAINSNKELSQIGKKTQLAKIDGEIQQFTTAAYNELKSSWAVVKIKMQRTAAQLAAADEAAAAQWDYNRLNYEARAIETAVMKADTISEVKKQYDAVMKSGDNHKRRAWAENLRGEISKRWGDSIEANRIKKQSEGDLQEITTTPELKELQDKAAQLASEAAQLYNTTKAAQGYFIGHREAGVNSLYGISNPFADLLQGVNVSPKVDPETLAASVSVTIE